MNRYFLILGFAVTTISAAITAHADETQWYKITTLSEKTPSQKIGQGHKTIQHSSDKIVITDTNIIHIIKANGRISKLSNDYVFTQNTKTGDISIRRITNLGGAKTYINIDVKNGKAQISRRTRFGKQNIKITLPDTVNFDYGEKLLHTFADINGVILDNFSTSTAAVEQVHYTLNGTLIGPEVGVRALVNGTKNEANLTTYLRKSFDNGQLRGVEKIGLDANHKVITTDIPIFGTVLRTTLTSKEDAQSKNKPINLLKTALVKSPYRIAHSARTGHIRYKFSFKDDIVFELPQTPEQMVNRVDGVAVVDICKACGRQLPTDEASLAQTIQPTLWLQSQDKKLQKMARGVAKKPISDADKMNQLARKARKQMTKIDFVGHYSALEALERRSGDCTEDAVILAALGRAAGIPTKVASGLVYSRQQYHGVSNAFMPHAWTLAYVDGHWQSFDMSFDGFDATHIALTIGDGDARSIAAANQLSSLLIWDTMSEIKARSVQEKSEK